MILLCFSSLIVRGIGMLLQILLHEKLGAEGLGLIHLCSSVVLFGALLCTSGLSVAVTRLAALDPANAVKLMRRIQLYAALFGLAVGVCLFVLAPWLTAWGVLDPRIEASIRVYALCLPFVAASACVKGLFLAHNAIGRITIAQIAEQTLRVLLCMGLLYTLQPQSIATMCTYVFLGTAVGEAFSLLLYEIMLPGFKRRVLPAAQLPRVSDRLPSWLSIALPITLATMLQSGMQTVESVLTPMLLTQSGALNAMADIGLLNSMVIPILFFPAVIPATVGLIRLPVATRLHAHAEQSDSLTALKQELKRDLGGSMIFSIYVTALLAGLAQPLMRLLYQSTEAGGLLLLLAPLAPLLYIDRLADSMLKAIGRQKASLVVEICDMALRFTLLVTLLPRIGFAGLLLMMALSSVFTCVTRIAVLLRACRCSASTYLTAAKSALPAVGSALVALLLALVGCALPVGDGAKLMLIALVSSAAFAGTLWLLTPDRTRLTGNIARCFGTLAHRSR